MNRVVSSKKGFTLIELLLAMAFISVLLLAVALTVIQIGTIYNRGMVLKEINQSSRFINDEIAKSIASTNTLSTVSGDGQYVSTDDGGRLCVGGYSYIWNYGKSLANNDPDLIRYSDSEEVIRFIKVPDSSALYCSGLPTYQNIASSGAVELLSAGDHDLVLHQLSLTAADTAIDELTGQQLVVLTYAVGTNEIEALNDTQTTCKPPNVVGSDLIYCAVQVFTIVLRAGNGVN